LEDLTNDHRAHPTSHSHRPAHANGSLFGRTAPAGIRSKLCRRSLRRLVDARGPAPRAGVEGPALGTIRTGTWCIEIGGSEEDSRFRGNDACAASLLADLLHLSAFNVLKDENTTAEQHRQIFLMSFTKIFAPIFPNLFAQKPIFANEKHTASQNLRLCFFIRDHITAEFFISREVEVLKIRTVIICTAQKMSPINFRLYRKKTRARFRGFKKIAQS
jgi:hypothetical protein